MGAKERILLVDDDPGVTRRLQASLQQEGYQVAVAVNGQDALEQLKSFHPHLILLDILMPWMDGRAFLDQLRAGGNWTPVIMLTRVGGVSQKARALNAGADDYIKKPFSFDELLARVGAVLRRVRPGQMPLVNADILVCGPLQIDRRSHTASLHGQPLALSPKAFQVLEYLMLHRDEVINQERLYQALWNVRSAIGPHALEVRISELRRALDDNRTAPCFLQTVSGEGYRFIGEVEVGV